MWLLTVLLFGCGDRDENEYNQQDWKPTIPAVLVKSETIGTGTVADTIEITGTLESIEQVNIIPETTGVVQNIFVREGDVVSKNQALAQVINANAIANLERSKIEIDRVTREFEKSQRLQAQGAISEREFQELQTQLKTAQASLSEAEATAKKSTIRSPIDGVVALVNVREGELATTAQLFQIVQPEKLRLVASVPERDLVYLKESQTVSIRAAYNEDQQVSGLVERIAPVVDTTTGSVRVFINVEEHQSILRPGQFVKAQVEVDRHENTIVVPKDGVVYEDGEPFAYIVTTALPDQTIEPTEDSPKDAKSDITDETTNTEPVEDTGPKLIADRRSLKLGYSDVRWVEVLEGVELDEEIITIGNHTLEDDSPIVLEVNIPEKALDSPDSNKQKETE